MTIFLVYFFFNTSLTANVTYLCGRDKITVISRPFAYKTCHFAYVLAEFASHKLVES